jgi:hypothetical protein
VPPRESHHSPYVLRWECMEFNLRYFHSSILYSAFRKENFSFYRLDRTLHDLTVFVAIEF